jgi:drug/metabolite transporter (DMT)-like permease
VFLIVMLSLAAVLSGLMSLFGTIAVTGGDTGAVSVSFWLLFIALFILSCGALVGVVRRSTWGRWVALAAGIAVCFTILGSVIGIPIIVAAARARTVTPARAA